MTTNTSIKDGRLTVTESIEGLNDFVSTVEAYEAEFGRTRAGGVKKVVKTIGKDMTSAIFTTAEYELCLTTDTGNLDLPTAIKLHDKGFDVASLTEATQDTAPVELDA